MAWDSAAIDGSLLRWVNLLLRDFDSGGGRRYHGEDSELGGNRLCVLRALCGEFCL